MSRRILAIKIGHGRYIKPRFCPTCGKLCIIAEHYRSESCMKCHRHHKNQKHHARRRLKRHLGLWHKGEKYNKSYLRKRARLIKEHPYCALCGSPDNLTAHHVGGGSEHLTVLCYDCHQDYERRLTLRKNRKCIRKNGIEKIITKLRSLALGIGLLIVCKRLTSRNLRGECESWNIR